MHEKWRHRSEGHPPVLPRGLTAVDNERLGRHERGSVACEEYERSMIFIGTRGAAEHVPTLQFLQQFGRYLFEIDGAETQRIGADIRRTDSGKIRRPRAREAKEPRLDGGVCGRLEAPRWVLGMIGRRDAGSGRNVDDGAFLLGDHLRRNSLYAILCTGESDSDLPLPLHLRKFRIRFPTRLPLLR